MISLIKDLDGSSKFSVLVIRVCNISRLHQNQ